jgi:hypothetical protein
MNYHSSYFIRYFGLLYWPLMILLANNNQDELSNKLLDVKTTKQGSVYFVKTQQTLINVEDILGKTEDCIKPNAGPDITIEEGDTIKLNATPVVGGYWSSAGPNPDAIKFSDRNDPKAFIVDYMSDDLHDGLVWSILGKEQCRDTVHLLISVSEPICEFTGFSAGPSIVKVCTDNTPATMANLFAQKTPLGGSWTQIGSLPSVAIFSDKSDPKTTIDQLIPGTYQLVWASEARGGIVEGYCRDTISVTVLRCAITPCPSQSCVPSSFKIKN